MFGDQPEAEVKELVRVTKPDGVMILCPGSSTIEEDRHYILISKGFEWSQFEVPGRGLVQKYWKQA